MSELLNKIKTPSDIKALSKAECEMLAQDLRQYIMDTVSVTGGHLASNLGVVELTIALFRTFDFPNDQVVWDVGHQAYAYKILTGRSEQFKTLRQWGGLAGFPKTEESEYDSFNTGHSSTSISAGLGLLRASKQLGENRHVIAVIGDGALTGGMAYEALNDAGQGDDKLIVVLNDNQMSISQNVGGMSKHLNHLRTSKRYRNFKGNLEDFLVRIPLIGKPLAGFLAGVKNGIRNLFLSDDITLFGNFGFTYYGPINGHDGEAVARALRAAADSDGPVLVHICTVKGYGYSFAEDRPQNYHGVSPFEPDEGVPDAVLPDSRKDDTESFEFSLRNSGNFTGAFSRCIQYFAVRDERVTAICAAMSGGTGLDAYAKLFPKRFYDVGIAEQHAVTLAAGMAAGGLRPIVAIYSTFMQRALDQVQHDVVLQNLPVLFCEDRSGIVGEDGETHQGLYDLSFLRGTPGGEVYSPRDYSELYRMMQTALAKDTGPTFLRYPKGSPLFTDEDRTVIRNFLRNEETETAEIGKAQWLRRGTDLNLLGWGYTTSLAWQAAKQLAEEGISAGVLDLRSLKPVDLEAVREASALPMILTEEAVRQGSVGQEIEAWLLQNETESIIKCIYIQDVPVLHGKRAIVLENYGISVDNILKEARKIAGERR